MKKEEKKISGITSYAVHIFRKLEQAKYRQELLEEELKDWILRIPEDEFDEYVQATDKIIEEFEKKRSKNPRLRGYIYNK